MLPNTHLRVIPTQAVALSALRLLREGAGQSFAFEQIRPRPELPEIAIRALGPEDARAFRNIALEALNRDGHFFATELAREAARSDAEWAAACTETADHAVFGGFVGNRSDRHIGIVRGMPYGYSSGCGSVQAVGLQAAAIRLFDRDRTSALIGAFSILQITSKCFGV